MFLGMTDAWLGAAVDVRFIHGDKRDCDRILYHMTVSMCLASGRLSCLFVFVLRDLRFVDLRR